MADVDALQRAYYTMGIIAGTVTVLAAAVAGTWSMVQHNRNRFRTLHARLDKLEKEAVSVTAFKEAMEDLLARFDQRWKDYMERIDERFDRSAERHSELKESIKRVEKAIADLPCPSPNGKGLC